MTPSISQLQGGVRDFCAVLDQTPTAFFWESFYMPHFRNSEVSADHLDALRNATIESSLLSIRILNDFFRAGGFPTDIKAHHYLGFSSPGEFLTPTERTNINKHLAHLTTERADAFPRSWPFYDLVVRAHNSAETFIGFLLSPIAAPYRPTNFELESRLAMCQGFEKHLQNYLKRQQ